jgi:hypothetical protein
VLTGRVTNVTSFGAFVDVGLKREGLVHVSAMSMYGARFGTNLLLLARMVLDRSPAGLKPSMRVPIACLSGVRFSYRLLPWIPAQRRRPFEHNNTLTINSATSPLTELKAVGAWAAGDGASAYH